MARSDGRRARCRGRAPRASEIQDPGQLAKRAETYALDLLALRPRTVWELRRRLDGRGYPAEVTDDLVERCSRVGYLDDRAFAEYWVEARCQSYPCGPARLRLELRQKGVRVDTVSSVLGTLLPPEREMELAVGLARRRVGATPSSCDRAAKTKLWDHLRRRGFGSPACLEAIRAVSGPSEELLEAGLAGSSDETSSEETAEDPTTT